MFSSGTLGSKKRELPFISSCHVLRAVWAESAGHLRLSRPTHATTLEKGVSFIRI